jgi:hypothetical protein
LICFSLNITAALLHLLLKLNQQCPKSIQVCIIFYKVSRYFLIYHELFLHTRILGSTATFYNIFWKHKMSYGTVYKVWRSLPGSGVDWYLAPLDALRLYPKVTSLFQARRKHKLHIRGRGKSIVFCIIICTDNSVRILSRWNLGLP